MNSYPWHDWTLVKIDFAWKAARVMIELEDSTFTKRVLIAEGVSELRIPRANEWGPSVSVNEVLETELPLGGGRCLRIEMQSGDVIYVAAKQMMLMPSDESPENHG